MAEMEKEIEGDATKKKEEAEIEDDIPKEEED